MPPFDAFSEWLEAISVHHWVLPTIGRIGAGKKWPHPWTPIDLGYPNQPFVQLGDWNGATGHIRTRKGKRPAFTSQIRPVNRHCLEAVYRRFEQLAIHGPAGHGSWALINGAYNKHEGKGPVRPERWQAGVYPGPPGFEICPDQILCPFLAPIMFLFCGASSGPATPAAAITYHNNAAHDFAEKHGLERYIPRYSYPPTPLPAGAPPTPKRILEAPVKHSTEAITEGLIKKLNVSGSQPPQGKLIKEEAGCDPCEQCPLWQLLATDTKYREWTETRTIGDEKNLEFRYLPTGNGLEIRLPRPVGEEVQGYPKTFSERQFKVMCCRFAFVTRTGPIPRSSFVGNTKFNKPKWTPPTWVFSNAQIDPPYIVAVVRKILEDNSHLDRAGYCPTQGNCG